MEVAPFFVDFHHFLSIFTIFYRFSRFTHLCRDLHFVAIYALFPQFFFGQNSLPRNITRFLHVCSDISQTSPEQFGGNRAEIQPFLHFHFPAEHQLRQLNMAGDNQMAGDHLLKLPVQLRKENPDILQHCC